MRSNRPQPSIFASSAIDRGFIPFNPMTLRKASAVRYPRVHAYATESIAVVLPISAATSGSSLKRERLRGRDLRSPTQSRVSWRLPGSPRRRASRRRGTCLGGLLKAAKNSINASPSNSSPARSMKLASVSSIAYRSIPNAPAASQKTVSSSFARDSSTRSHARATSVASLGPLARTFLTTWSTKVDRASSA